MRRNEIYIHGRKLQVGDDQRIALTRQVNEIAEPSVRHANRSTTFRVHHVGDNELKLNFAARPESRSRLPYSVLPARLVQDGFELVSEGTAIIRGGDDTSTELTLYWGNNNFFDRLEFPLSELDLSDFDHQYVVSGTGKTVLTIGYLTEFKFFYPFIDLGHGNLYVYDIFGSVYPGLFLDIEKSQPAISFRELLLRIVKHVGFTVSGGILDDPEFAQTSILLPHKRHVLPNKEQYFVKSQSTQDSGGAKWGIVPFRHNVIISDPAGDSFPTDVGIGQWANTRYRYRAGFQARVKFRVVLNYEFDNTEAGGTYLIFNVARTIVVHNRSVEEIIYTENINESFNTPRTLEFELDMPDPYAVFYMYTRSAAVANLITVKPGSTFEMIDINRTMIIGDTYKAADNMPDITAFDFIQMLFKMYGLIFECRQREITLFQFKDIINSKKDGIPLPFAIVPKVWNVQFQPQGYYQENTLSYDDGFDEVEANRSGSFFVDNLTLEKKGSFIEIDAYMAGEKLLVGIGVVSAIGLFDAQGEKSDIERGIFSHHYRFSARVGDDVTVPVLGFSFGNLNTNPTAPHFVIHPFVSDSHPVPFADINFIKPTFLLENHYRGLASMLNTYREYEFEVFINQQQFNDINHFQAYYVKEIQGFAYIEKVNNFMPGRTTKIKMIRL